MCTNCCREGIEPGDPPGPAQGSRQRSVYSTFRYCFVCWSPVAGVNPGMPSQRAGRDCGVGAPPGLGLFVTACQVWTKAWTRGSHTKPAIHRRNTLRTSALRSSVARARMPAHTWVAPKPSRQPRIAPGFGRRALFRTKSNGPKRNYTQNPLQTRPKGPQLRFSSTIFPNRNPRSK